MSCYFEAIFQGLQLGMTNAWKETSWHQGGRFAPALMPANTLITCNFEQPKRSEGGRNLLNGTIACSVIS
jgi:hypothetical protein